MTTVSDTPREPMADASREPRAAAPATGVRPIWLVVAVIVLLGGFGALFAVTLQHQGTSSSHHVFEYTIPPGTGAAIEQGQKLYVFPARLDVHVGDELLIHNDDSQVATVGPYTVDRNATLEQTFVQAGRIVGFCSIHPSGQVTIVVSD